MSLTGNIFFATGVLHNTVGILVPELAEPLWRIIADGGIVATEDIHERYAREATLWFQVIGFAAMIQGYYVRHMALEMKKQGLDEEAPVWFGWAVVTLGGVSAYCMPISGFHLAYLQGLRVLWIHYNRHGSKGSKKVV
ncbi:expressed unknown protein [Seminavis robusta]|uniref:Uncharacterized protein n=1 Tax=Seminavis robusta TaxID=568900 RepID=A0A9N8E5V6_9STRA|nr:expressed unknown protein [Seminavis robusta]|eukprot:Sro652_g181750.1 n/a (138) ;mRNA; f:19145-19558